MTSLEFQYRDGQLFCEGVALKAIAEQHGTPCYIYSAKMIRDRFRAFDSGLAGLDHTVHFAVKANSNLSILRLLAQEGSGFDIVSAGELFRVLEAGGQASKVVFSGVGKTAEEMEYAIKAGVRQFNCESAEELDILNGVCERLKSKAEIGLRVNPDVDASTHPYISTGLKEHKFGIDIDVVEGVYEYASSLPWLTVQATSCHIGSQLLDATPLLEAADKMLSLIDRLAKRGIVISRFDFGGGLGVSYRPEDETPSISDYTAQLKAKLLSRPLHLMLEPGRSIVAEAGALLTKVILKKRNGNKEFVIVDAAMNDLIRPALYKAFHPVQTVVASDISKSAVDLVGPVCESGDFLAKDCLLPPTKNGDLLSIGVAGAYGFVLSSQYNSRPRIPEVLVDGTDLKVIRRRETWEDLVAAER
jgi:diaminopimelate decarboxylase